MRILLSRKLGESLHLADYEIRVIKVDPELGVLFDVKAPVGQTLTDLPPVSQETASQQASRPRQYGKTAEVIHIENYFAGPDDKDVDQVRD